MKMTRDRWIGVAMIMPSIVLIGLFVYGFIGQTAWSSMTNWEGLAANPKIDFIGLQNFTDLFTSLLNSRFRGDIVNTIFFTIFFLAACLSLGLLLAILMAVVRQQAGSPGCLQPGRGGGWSTLRARLPVGIVNPQAR